ncbi:phosphatidylinositol-glycan biosynthesis class X protein [Rhinichthys klamathensis goyatoka]|uniref:phosphatidylinositol-glycan biosynthesis class X protein n=1 Tax=Rhinichthys klamathensis goyatoka TaxID=3034132 RepID=UPI0024B4CBE9|nr:phosphatidylinositol-glycan biosynthesis class X protein [Rhinichthys klamathensis goyatoka]
MHNFYLLATVLYLIHNGKSQEADHCFPSEFLESLSMSMKITKAGFHRDLLYTVEWGEVDHDVKALLVQKLPSGVYMDEYQLETLRHDTGLEVLLDSKVDLEAPEYLSTGFTALVFLSGKHEATVPVHGRYHRPSDSGQERVTVELESPRLLVRSDQCDTLRAVSPPHEATEAPCAVSNHSVCSWLEIRRLQNSNNLRQDTGSVSLEIPVGDSSMILSVCVGTVLTTALSCVFLLRSIWTHGTF